MTKHLGEPSQKGLGVEDAVEQLLSIQTRAWTLFVERRQSHGPVEPTRMQMMVLTALDQRGSHTVSELANLLHVSTPTASQSVNVLVARGWCEIVLSRQDRRRHHVNLTEKGRTVLGERMDKRLTRMRQVLQHLNGQERAQLITLLDRIIGVWQTQEGSSENGG